MHCVCVRAARVSCDVCVCARESARERNGEIREENLEALAKAPPVKWGGRKAQGKCGERGGLGVIWYRSLGVILRLIFFTAAWVGSGGGRRVIILFRALSQG